MYIGKHTGQLWVTWKESKSITQHKTSLSDSFFQSRIAKLLFAWKKSGIVLFLLNIYVLGS